MRVRVLIVALVLGASCAALVACGDRSKLIPSGDAGRIQGDLDNLQSRVSGGDCERVRAALQQLINDVTELPSTVDVQLRNRINEGVEALTRQAPKACAEAQPTETTPTETTETTDTATTETETTDTAPTDTTPTDTTTTETVPPDTTPTDTTPTDTTPTTTEGTGGAGVTTITP